MELIDLNWQGCLAETFARMSSSAGGQAGTIDIFPWGRTPAVKSTATDSLAIWWQMLLQAVTQSISTKNTTVEDKGQESELCTAYLLYIIVKPTYGKPWNVVILPKPLWILGRQTVKSLEHKHQIINKSLHCWAPLVLPNFAPSAKKVDEWNKRKGQDSQN